MDRKQPSQHFDIIFYVAPRKSLTWLDGTFNWHGEMIHLPLCMLKSLELIEHVNISFWKGWKSFQRKRKSYMFCVFSHAHEDSAAAEFLRHLQTVNGKKLLVRSSYVYICCFILNTMFKQGEKLQTIILSSTLLSQVAAYSQTLA